MSIFAINIRHNSNGRRSWLQWTVFVVVAIQLLLCTINAQFLTQSNSTNEIHHRRLQVEDGGVSSTTGDSRARYVQKKSAAKSDRMKRILSVINLKPHVVGNNLKPESWGAQHNPSGNAIFAVLMN